MKRTLYAALALIIIGLMLTACNGSSEQKGVPDSMVMNSEAYMDFAEMYSVDHCEITHNVDNEIHTDIVTLSMSSDGEYATVSCVYTLSYQYYQSDDLWVLIESGDGSYSTELIPEKFINNSGWSGWHKNTESVGYFNNEFYYTIYIKDIDLENATITMIYDFSFSNNNFDDLTQSTPVTLELDKFGGTAYIVRIDVEGLNTPFLDGSINFILDEEGLSEFNY